MAVLTVAELGVAFGGWRVRHYQHSLEVLMITAGVVVLPAGLIWDWADTDGGGVRQWIARVLGGLYGVLALFVLLFFVLGDLGVFASAPAYRGKAVATPDAELLLPLPAGLTVVDDTTSCKDSNAGGFCDRTFAIAAADGTPDDRVAGRLLAHLGDSAPSPSPAAPSPSAPSATANPKARQHRSRSSPPMPTMPRTSVTPPTRDKPTLLTTPHGNIPGSDTAPGTHSGMRACGDPSTALPTALR
ncbi:hypothetical protein ACFXO9_33910 [Nocardia tengchongensis]|uniref:hypothetical protein n=1 Tax=Nocardia tengchongensis TaxID=2055889 RepID=UPI0036915BCD